MTDKQKWLERETHKVHNAIDDNLEEWIKRVDVQYNIVFSTLLDELESILKDFNRGNLSETYLRGRFSTLTIQAQQRAQEIGIELSREMPEKLKQFYDTSYDGMNEILKRVSTKLPTYAIEFAAGYRYEDYTFQSSVYKSGIRLGTKLNDVLSEGLAKGWNIRKYNKELRRVTDFTVYEANRVARTETARVNTEGSKRAMKEYDVERVEWSAALEKRTCQRCAALNGKKFKLGSEPPLPLHPHCRCVLIPVVD